MMAKFLRFQLTLSDSVQIGCAEQPVIAFDALSGGMGGTLVDRNPAEGIDRLRTARIDVADGSNFDAVPQAVDAMELPLSVDATQILAMETVPKRGLPLAPLP